MDDLGREPINEEPAPTDEDDDGSEGVSADEVDDVDDDADDTPGDVSAGV